MRAVFVVGVLAHLAQTGCGAGPPWAPPAEATGGVGEPDPCDISLCIIDEFPTGGQGGMGEGAEMGGMGGVAEVGGAGSFGGDVGGAGAFNQ